MAEDKDLIFPMKLELDVKNFEVDWKKIEPKLQAVLDKNPLKVKIDIDDAKLSQPAEAIKKNLKGAESAVEGSINAMKQSIKSITNEAYNINILEDSGEISQLIQESRVLKSEITGVVNAALPLKDILSIGGKNPTGLELKRMKDELQRFINAEKEGSADAVKANEKLLDVKERIRNMYGKQESALKATDEEKQINSTISAYKRLSAELDKINATVRARASMAAGTVIPSDKVSVLTMGTKEEAAIYTEISNAMDRYKQSLSAANQERLKATPVEVAKKEIDLNNQNLKIQERIAANAQKQTELWQRYDAILKKPENTLQQIQAKINQISAIKQKLNMDDSEVRQSDATIAALQAKLASLRIPSGSLSAQFKELNRQWTQLTETQRAGAEGQRLIAQYQRLTQVAGQAAGTIKSAAKAQDDANKVTDKATSSLKLQAEAQHKNLGMLNGMKQFLNSYISILGAYRLGQNIVDTTAEFEMQRVALAAIIQDKQKADQLFSQNVELGLQSPFQIKELITYTKQLAAFRIETDQLFDTTKRLADVSAGLGVDMGRLILAYGQVRAASVLRGQEVRQFTEAGIPIINLLADKLTKLNGVATSTADVFKLISERGVSFEMVKEVFEDMTNAGGTFYRMQEIQAKTLKGSLANLTDAYQKMFMEMGNAKMAPLKAAINGLREMMENWKIGAAVLTDVAIGYGIAKVSILAYNAALGKENAANIASIMSAKKKEASLLRQSSAYKKLNTKELRKIATSKAMTVADWEQLVVAGKLNEADVLRLVAFGKMSPEMAKKLIATEAVTKAEWELTAAQIGTAASSKKLTVAFRLMTASAWAATKALLTNPLTWVVVAAAGVFKLGSSIYNFHSKYKTMTKDVRRESQLLANEMTDAWRNMSETIEKGLKAGASSESMVSARKSLQDILSKNELIRDVLNERLKAIDDEAVRLGIVKDMWDTVHEAAKGGDGDFAISQKTTGAAWFNRDVVKNAERFNEQFDKIIKKYGDLGNAGEDIGLFRQEFEDLRNEFLKGEMSMIDFKNKLERIMPKGYDKVGKTMYGMFASLKKYGQEYEWDMNAFMDSYIERIGKIDGQMPDRTQKMLGLTKDTYNKFLGMIATDWQSWMNVLGDDADAGTKRILTTFMKIKTQFPNLGSGDGVKDSAFIQSYNAFIQSRGLSTLPVLETPETGDAPTDSSQRKVIEEERKSAKERLQAVKDMLKTRGVLKAELIAELESEKAQLELKIKERDLVWDMIFGGTDKPETKTDPRITALKGQLDLVVDAYDNYLKRVKQVGETQARADVEGIYGGQNAEIKGITSGLPLAFTPEGLNAVIEQAKKGFEDLGKDAVPTLWGVIRKQNDENFEELTRNFKTNLDKLANEIQQTQRANEFYEKMLGLTGSADMAERLTKAMGMTVGDVRESMKKALSGSMKVEVSDGVVDDYGKGVNMSDVNEIQAAINKMPENTRAAAQKQLDTLVDYEQKQLAEIYSGLDDYMTAQQKKVKIAENTARKIKQIQDNPNLKPEQKSELIGLQRKGEAQEYGKIDLEELKKTDEFIRAFEDLSRVGGDALDKIYADLLRLSKQAGLSATDLKTITDLMKKIRDQKESSNPFQAWGEAISEYKNALSADNDEMMLASAQKLAAAGKNIASAFSTTITPLEKTISLVADIADGLGIAFSADTKSGIDDFMKGFKVMSDAMEVMNSILALNTLATQINTSSKTNLAAANTTVAATEVAVAAGATAATGAMTALATAIWAVLAPLWPLLAVAAAVGAVFLIVGAKARRLEKEQEKLDESIADLDRAYQKLEKSAKDAFGEKYVKLVQQQQKILLAKQQAALKQAQAERGKGKKEDEKKTKAYMQEAEDYAQQAADKVAEINQKMSGYSSVESAAVDFANAWLDAYVSFENTADAIGDKFKEMIDNMIVQSILAAAVAAKLAPVFALIEGATDPNSPGGVAITKEEMAGINNLTGTLTIGMDSELRGLVEGTGINVRASDKSLTGISASVSAMSEDTANTLGGYLNMGLMQWVQQTNLQTQILAAIQTQDIKTPLANMYDLQQQSLAAINAIKSDTGRLVASNAELVTTVKSVLNGTGTKGLNVYLRN